MGAEDTEATSVFRCAECDAGLAHDQRYCIECGPAGERCRRRPPRRWRAFSRAVAAGGVSRPGGDSTEPATGLEPCRCQAGCGRPARRRRRSSGCSASAWSSARRSERASPACCRLALVVVMAGRHPAPASHGGQLRRRLGQVAAEAAAAAGPPTTDHTATTPDGSTQQQTTPTLDHSAPGRPPYSGLPPIKHVFLIVLSDQRYNATFGSAQTRTSRRRWPSRASCSRSTTGSRAASWPTRSR